MTQRRLATLTSICLVPGLLVVSAPPVRAWGAVGHHIVARLAWALMSQTAQIRASALVNGGQDAFIAASTWADEVRPDRPETYNWHFVNIPVGESRYDATRDCPPTDRGDCVIAAIARLRLEVSDEQLSRDRRGEALKFIIHFVGDLHQPLHSIGNNDRGGNDVRVNALRGEDGRATNLHAVWDTGLINLSSETEAARADRLLAELKKQPLKVEVDVVRWVEESQEVARRVAYNYPSFAAGGPGADPITLDDAYRTAALATIDQRLTLGGARLAALMNLLLDR